MTAGPVIVLASASPARRRLLRAAGIEPLVRVSNVDEPAIERELRDAGNADPAELCLELARRKAAAVAGLADLPVGAIVVGADSVLDLDGAALGKPADAAAALARWQAMAGRTGVLRTGHAVVDTATARSATAVVSTSVRFGTPDPVELAAYVASGEPVQVAGAFTLDGLAAPFVAGIDGDPSNVIGLSLPTVRRLLAELGVRWTDLWS
jgi:septum formation protein